MVFRNFTGKNKKCYLDRLKYYDKSLLRFSILSKSGLLDIWNSNYYKLVLYVVGRDYK